MAGKISTGFFATVRTKFLSPFLYGAVAWTIVLVCYNFYWSDLLPQLSPEVFLFFVWFIFTLFLLFYFSRKLDFSFFIDFKKELKKCKTAFFLCFFMFVIEAVAAKGFPLLNIINGNFTYSYKTRFGLPVVHVVLNAVSLMYIAKSWTIYKFTKQKKFMIWAFVFFFPGVLTFTRSFIMYGILYCIVISFSLKKWTLKTLPKTLGVIAVLGALVLFSFSVAGEVRMKNVSSGENYIEDLAKPSASFEKTELSPVILWAYCYIATPLANLQNTINIYSENKNTDIDRFTVFFTHFMPDMVNQYIPKSSRKAKLIVPYFNVSTIFADSFACLGWIAMFYSVAGSCLLILCIYFIQHKKSIYSYLSFVFLSVIMFFNMFENMFNFMGTSPQFILSVIFSFSWKKIVKVSAK